MIFCELQLYYILPIGVRVSSILTRWDLLCYIIKYDRYPNYIERSSWGKLLKAIPLFIP